MADRAYIEENARELARLRALVERLGDDELRRPVNEHWTVAGVLGHAAFWDARALVLAERILAGEPFSDSDAEPEDPRWINDAARPLLHAIAPRDAARVALEIATATDERVAALSDEQLARTWPRDPASPLNVLRARHRSEHLDEIEAALAR